MLPDFPKVRDYASEILRKWFYERVSKRTGVLQEMKNRVLHEGDKVELHRSDGSIDIVAMESQSAEIRLELEEFKKFGLNAVLKTLDKTAIDVAEKQTKFFFSRLNTICDESGQTSDAKGRPISYDLIFEMLEGIDIDFDDSGNPIFPTLISSPKIKSCFDKVEMTDEQKERFEKLIEQKRSEWRDRESDRRLVS